MASRNLAGAVGVFATLDTRHQADIVRRVGIDTIETDRLLFNLRANHPERWQALAAFMGDDLS